MKSRKKRRRMHPQKIMATKFGCPKVTKSGLKWMMDSLFKKCGAAGGALSILMMIVVVVVRIMMKSRRCKKFGFFIAGEREFKWSGMSIAAAVEHYSFVEADDWKLIIIGELESNGWQWKKWLRGRGSGTLSYISLCLLSLKREKWAVRVRQMWEWDHTG